LILNKTIRYIFSYRISTSIEAGETQEGKALREWEEARKEREEAASIRERTQLKRPTPDPAVESPLQSERPRTDKLPTAPNRGSFPAGDRVKIGRPKGSKNKTVRCREKRSRFWVYM